MNKLTRTTEQNFTLARLANDQVEVTVIPALGAKLSSLRALPTGREWMWRPDGPLRLFANTITDEFTAGTLIGADECIPTVNPCRFGERDLPDHGETWSQLWKLEDADGVIRTSLRMPISPFTITRTVSLDGGTVVLDYELLNHAAVREPFLWAFHPLLNFVEGDILRVPAEVRTVKVTGGTLPGIVLNTDWSWPSPAPEIDLSKLRLESDRATAKFFTPALSEGRAALEHSATRDRLELRWPVAETPYLGVWITRGGWRGAHHSALEPTNAPFDSLADALAGGASGLFVAPGQTRRWQVTLHPTVF